MATKRKKNVPELLWRLFGSSAKTLAETIKSLIPPSPEREAACRCRGKRCLGCCGDDPMSFIIRPGDPLDYLQLLRKCFVVVSDAPRPVPKFEDIWSQSELVIRTVEIMRSDQPYTSNLICDNYDKGERKSLAVEELTTPRWDLLLSRVGHDIMVYLLRHTSIFLPLSRKNHLQICGHPISNLRSKFSAPMPRYEVKQKRKRVDGDELPRKQLRVEGYEPLSNSSNSSTSNVGDDSNMPKKRRRECQGKRQKKCCRSSDQGTPSSSQCNLGDIANCFCCKVFQNKPWMKGNADIDRSGIFYKMEKCSTVLPENHMVYTLSSNRSGASLLFNDIFEAFGVQRNARSVPCCHRRNGCRFTCLYHRLMMSLRTLIRNINIYKRESLLEKHCPTRSSCQDASTRAGNVSEVAMAENRTTMLETNLNPVASITHCPKRQVVSFIWAICRRLVPRPLLGGLSSWRSLCRNISKFIELRRFEKFSLKECLHGLKISDFPFFSKQHPGNKHPGCGSLGVTDNARHMVFNRWIYWFFRHLITLIIRTNFYVTDSEHGKHALLYYKKSDWRKLMKSNNYGKGNQYVELTFKGAKSLIDNRSYGFSKARLLPKNNEFRLLSNLQAPSRFFRDSSSSRTQSNQKLRRNASVNSVVQDVHLVLRSLQTSEQEKLGASVFDYNDVFKKLVPFLRHLKSGSGDMLNVFMVVSDVAKAFDSIKHKKLFTVMKDLVVSNEFSFEKLTQVICTSKYLKIDQQQMLPREDIIAASKRVKSRSCGQSLGNVIIKKELSKKMRREEILSLLEEHIKGNLLKIGSKFYLQARGIPQGSVVSTLLCSFFYGHMEKKMIFPFLEEAKKDLFLTYPSHDGSCQMEVSTPGCEYLLLRFIDDFFFLSTSKKHASMFYKKFEEVAGDYNCKMNKKKYGLNFVMDDGEVCQSNKLHIGKDNTSFLRWSGLLVNCSTLEIQADYARYLNCHLSSTLTVSRRGKMGKILKEKLKGYLMPKCHPIFYDSNINSPGVVRLNIYQAFLLCAMKFVSHLHNLSVLPRFTSKFIFDAIMSSLSYMERMIERKMHSFQVDHSIRPKYDVSDREVMWLGLCAYVRVLKKKQSRYKNLLCMLRTELKEGYGEVENMPPELKYAVDDVHSEVLLRIKF